METIRIKFQFEIPINFTGLVIWPNNDKEWFVEGKYHRLDGPACECADGSKFWYVEGKRHRLDGPAIEWADGSKFWFVESKVLTFEQFWKQMKDTEYAPKIMAYMLGAKSK